MYTPYVVKNFLESETNTLIKKVEPNLERRVISEETSKLVRFALESVVANGTGKNAYIENYRVGGKTGTAQTVENGVYSASKYILSFIGFMPADNPEVVVYVAIQNAKNVVQYGGTVSAPIAKNIMLSAIDILGIKPSKEVMPREYTWMDQKYVILPDVVGENLDNAKKILNGFKLEYSGQGTNIVYQSPEAGTYVKENSNVILMLN
ncbi:MAG: PASTA domain-containing protein [Firmicutes bacterium]|nr:PASTA domain-containing protein [Bacillota bacterium]